MTRELFVWWRVADDEAAAAEAAARQMQGRLRAAEPSLVARLYRRAEAGRVTLMETYSQPGGGIDDATRGRIETAAAALAPWCGDGQRHIEVFEDCS